MPVIQSSVMQRFDRAEHHVDGALRLLQYVEARRPTGRRLDLDPEGMDRAADRARRYAELMR
jgi:hypothetical protein